MSYFKSLDDDALLAEMKRTSEALDELYAQQRPSGWNKAKTLFLFFGLIALLGGIASILERGLTLYSFLLLAWGAFSVLVYRSSEKALDECRRRAQEIQAELDQRGL